MSHTLRSWLVLVETQVKLLLRNRSILIGSLGLAVISMLIFGSLLSGNSAPLSIALVDEDHLPRVTQELTHQQAGADHASRRVAHGRQQERWRRGSVKSGRSILRYGRGLQFAA